MGVSKRQKDSKARQGEERKKEDKFQQTVPIDPTFRSLKCGVYTTINSLVAAQNLDMMIADNITAEAKATKHKKNQNYNIVGIIVKFQADALGIDALINGASV